MRQDTGIGKDLMAPTAYNPPERALFQMLAGHQELRTVLDGWLTNFTPFVRLGAHTLIFITLSSVCFMTASFPT